MPPDSLSRLQISDCIENGIDHWGLGHFLELSHQGSTCPCCCAAGAIAPQKPRTRYCGKVTKCRAAAHMMLLRNASDTIFSIYSCEMVGAARIELTTFCTQNRRATRLRYAPTDFPLKGIDRLGKPRRSRGATRPSCKVLRNRRMAHLITGLDPETRGQATIDL